MERVTLITGASKGIGLASARLLAERGHTVVGLARHATDDRFPGALHLVDLSDRQELAEMLRRLTAQYRFNGLVNNVGFVTPQLLDALELAAYDQTFEVNATSAMLCAQALSPGMQAQRFGRIVNIASEVVLGMTRRTAYAAAKAVLISFTRTWALELAGHGITVNTVSPGPVDTEFFAANNPSGSALRQSKVDRIPRGRIGLPADVANAVGFFMQAESEFVTGQNLYVCGGSSLGSSSFL